jgi:hypothetical protein
MLWQVFTRSGFLYPFLLLIGKKGGLGGFSKDSLYRKSPLIPLFQREK